MNFPFSFFNFKKFNHQPSPIKHQSAFTLIELLVSISIIAVLITVGLSSYSAAQKKARDAKRKADLRDIRTALEQYYNVCRFQYALPNNGDGTFYDTIICDLGGGQILNIMTKVPTDPRNDATYVYKCLDPPATNCTALSFTICATLESESPADYCVSNSQ